MEKYYLQSVGTPIISEQGQRLGKLEDVIINPDTGKIAGFSLGSSGKKFIAQIDVLSWSSNIKVNDISDIVEAGEVIQIEKILEDGRTIYRKKVFTKNEEFIGIVIDMGLDNKLFKLNCLVVAKGFLGIIFWDKKIIAAQDIIEIREKKIIVKNLVKPVKMKKLRVALNQQ